MRRGSLIGATALLLAMLFTGCSGSSEKQSFMGIPLDEVVISGKGELSGGECVVYYEGEIRDREITEQICRILNEVSEGEKADEEQYAFMSDNIWLSLTDADHSQEIHVRYQWFQQEEERIALVRFSEGDNSSTCLASQKVVDELRELLHKGVVIQENYQGEEYFPMTMGDPYSAVISVEDIKNEFQYDDSRDIMPLYNVGQTEEFDFTFRFDAYENNIDLYDFVSVHTDAACDPESMIYYTASLSVDNGETLLTISPMRPVLATDFQKSSYVYEGMESWGNAPIYYLALHYDLEADHPVRLKQPTVIPFTVKREVDTPTIRGVVSDDGRFSLAWDQVAGAEKYIVYHLIDNSLKTGVDNHAINGAQSGYDCGQNTAAENQLFLLRTGETTECSFDGFSGSETHSLVEVSDLLTGKTGNRGQNFGVCGEYFVTAVIDGVESGLSNAVSTAELTLPYIVRGEEEVQGRYPTPADFPAQVTVQNIDGSTTIRNVHYERVHVEYYEYQWDEYDYVIEGTYLYGSVGFEEDTGNPPQPPDTQAKTGNTAPGDDMTMVPLSDVQTIIPAEDNAGNMQDSLIHAQTDNTRSHITSGNLLTVNRLPDDVYLNADTAEEKWLALNLLQGNADISVEGFTSLQNPYTLKDTFYKVYYQNPCILGIRSFSYDYNELRLKVTYLYDQETIWDKQQQMLGTARRIVDSSINDSMSIQEKIEALYLYLVNHSVYDHDALAEAENSGFVKTENFTHEDAFNAYGVLVDEKGVCMSYAYAFRLLCDLSGVDCIVTTGYLDGRLPHAWNMVNIDNQWYEIDCTNNAVNIGIPFYLFQADSRLAEDSGYIKDKMFTLDADFRDFRGNDDRLEYYAQSGLCPQSMEEYKQLITEHLTEDTDMFIVRWEGSIDEKAFERAVMLAYHELGMEDMLDTLRYSIANGFIILINDTDKNTKNTKRERTL